MNTNYILIQISLFMNLQINKISNIFVLFISKVTKSTIPNP